MTTVATLTSATTIQQDEDGTLWLVTTDRNVASR